MSQPVAVFTNDMFRLSAYRAGMKVNVVADLPQYCVQVLDPELMVPVPMYIKVELNPGYDRGLDRKTVIDSKHAMVKDLMSWHIHLGMQPPEAIRAAENVPVWHLIPSMFKEMGAINGVGQAVGFRMCLTPCFNVKAYRQIDDRTLECRSNVFGCWSEQGQTYAWVMESVNVRLAGDGRYAVQYGGISVNRESFGESLNEEVIKRWPYLATPGLEAVRPQFEVLDIGKFNTLFPKARMILDVGQLAK